MARKKVNKEEKVIIENISKEPLEEVMGDRYATYAKYVIQDRAIPDVRDGLKPVQRRIVFSMYKNNNLFNRPTKKCAHTVGAVMGTFHPHGDTSIYDALARMSQDWKMRYPLIDFQGNNGSLDGDAPAAYRYTESRLNELSNELIKDIDKQTVDMQLNFDDTEFEPIVLPSRFPNLLVNGTEGIAVALATEIPPHNLKEVINAIIYRLNHRNNVTIDELMAFIPGPDFPLGGYIYNSPSLKSIYETGKGRIEIASKTEIVEQKDLTQIVISEIPYKGVKSQIVYEIDKIAHSKAIDGIIEVRDESDYKGIRIVVDIKKDAKSDLILQYLLNKTSLCSGYTANMVAIVDGRPKTLNLLDFIDSYITHQEDVITRRSKFELNKNKERLHIVDGLLIALSNIKEVTDIISKSKDKADSKVNLIKRFNISNEQAEAIVMLPLYKLSASDVSVLEKEKETLNNLIEYLSGILSDSKKLDKVIIKDLKEIAEKYGDERRTLIIEKGETKAIDKRDLIAKEDTMVAITYDGYIKRSSIKSFKSSGESLPGIKDGDMLIGFNEATTLDYIICFTNQGNYLSIPIHSLNENKWKDVGSHLNEYCTLNAGEKIISACITNKIRNDIYLAVLTKFGQIKRMCFSSLDLLKRSRPFRYMKLLNDDSVISISFLSGNSDLLIICENGNASLYNENELTIVSNKAGGVKSISGLAKTYAASLFSIAPNEKVKIVLVTDKGHQRIVDPSKINKTLRLGRLTSLCPSFKNDVHKVIGGAKFMKNIDSGKLNLYYTDRTNNEIIITDWHLTDNMYAKNNMELPPRALIYFLSDEKIENLNSLITYPPLNKYSTSEESLSEDKNDESSKNEDEKEEGNFEQISIFDDLDN